MNKALILLTALVMTVEPVYASADIAKVKEGKTETETVVYAGKSSGTGAASREAVKKSVKCVKKDVRQINGKKYVFKFFRSTGKYDIETKALSVYDEENDSTRVTTEYSDARTSRYSVTTPSVKGYSYKKCSKKRHKAVKKTTEETRRARKNTERETETFRAAPVGITRIKRRGRWLYVTATIKTTVTKTKVHTEDDIEHTVTESRTQLCDTVLKYRKRP